jgi:hypothetical protein
MSPFDSGYPDAVYPCDITICRRLTRSSSPIHAATPPRDPTRIASLDREFRPLWLGTSAVAGSGTRSWSTCPIRTAERGWTSGKFFSEAVHVVERFTMVDANTIHYKRASMTPRPSTPAHGRCPCHQANADPRYEVFEEPVTRENGHEQLLAPAYSVLSRTHASSVIHKSRNDDCDLPWTGGTNVDSQTMWLVIPRSSLRLALVAWMYAQRQRSRIGCGPHFWTRVRPGGSRGLARPQKRKARPGRSRASASQELNIRPRSQKPQAEAFFGRECAACAGTCFVDDPNGAVSSVRVAWSPK